MFGDNDIAIVDEAKQGQAPETKTARAGAGGGQGRGHRHSPGEGGAGGGGRLLQGRTIRCACDLRKMGSVSLLTREGEVEIAKRIEDGEKEVLDAVLHSSIAIKEIIQIGERLKKGKMRVREVIRDAPDEDDETFDEQGRTEQVVKLIDRSAASTARTSI